MSTETQTPPIEVQKPPTIDELQAMFDAIAIPARVKSDPATVETARQVLLPDSDLDQLGQLNTLRANNKLTQQHQVSAMTRLSEVKKFIQNNANNAPERIVSRALTLLKSRAEASIITARAESETTEAERMRAESKVDIDKFADFAKKVAA